MQDGITLTKASFILNIILLLYSYNNGELPFFITGDLPATTQGIKELVQDEENPFSRKQNIELQRFYPIINQVLRGKRKKQRKHKILKPAALLFPSRKAPPIAL